MSQPLIDKIFDAAYDLERDYNRSYRFCIKDALSKIEREVVCEALNRCKQNRTEAARLLGINRTTLVMKIKSLRECA